MSYQSSKIERERAERGSDRLGLGASIPKEDEIKRQKLETDEKLRRQLLGKDYKKFQNNRVRNGDKIGLGISQTGPKPRPVSMRQQVNDSEDEGGRSSIGKSKRRKLGEDLQSNTATTDIKPEVILADTSSSLSISGSPKKPSNYLDEVLVKKSQKRSKKSKH